MDLEGIRTNFYDQCRRHDLVGTDVDGLPDPSVNNGADWYINEGIRTLDGLLPNRINRKTYTTTVNAGDYYVDIPACRAILDVYVHDSEGYVALTRLTHRRTIEMYGLPLADADQSTPCHWCESGHAADATPAGTVRLVFMPPADATFTLSVSGIFYSDALVNNTDSNWWTATHPGLVVLAALYELETAMRNREGARDWLAAIDLRIKAIEFDIAEQESSNKTEAEG